MIHRHLEYSLDGGPEQWPLAAIADLLDRGNLDDWKPLVDAVARDPFGPVAERVARLIDAFPMYGTSPLWRAYLERRRAFPTDTVELFEGWPLADLRRRAGLTQNALASRLQISQSDLSKLERRRDWRLSTLRRYVSALGGRLRLTVEELSGPPAEEVFERIASRTPVTLGQPAAELVQDERRAREVS